MKILNRSFLIYIILGKIILASFLLCTLYRDSFSWMREAVASDEKNVHGPYVKGPEKVEETGRIPLEFLIKKKTDLEKKEEDLERKKIDLLALQEEINAKLSKLTQLRGEIKVQIETKKAVEDQRLKHLIKAYSAMKPQVAAGLIEKLELSFAVELLAKMQGDAVGSILAFVEKEKAAKISERLAKPREGFTHGKRNEVFAGFGGVFWLASLQQPNAG